MTRNLSTGGSRPIERHGMFAAVACRVTALAIVILASAGAEAPASDQLEPATLRQVKVRGEIGRRIDITAANNLLVIDVDQEFLRPFREKKGREGGYVGLGKLIDTLVRLAAYTEDRGILSLKKRVVAETIRTQEPEGYVGMFVPEKRLWTLWDVADMGYVIYGLASDSQFFHEKASLQAARKLADYVIARWSAEPRRIPGNGSIAVVNAQVGLPEALLALYAQTREPRYLDFCVKHLKLPEWDVGIVLGRWGTIEGHAYGYLAQCLCQLWLNRLQPDPRLLQPTRRAVDFLTKQGGLVITGACGDHECWHDTQSGTINLGETCATAYLLRVLDELVRLEGDSRYGDVMERVIYNTLFAAQSPDGRRIRYYTPFDGPRTYFPQDSYCCPNNYRRIVADLPAMIYYQSENGVAINLYTASTAALKIKDGLSVRLRQETDYPSSGRVRVRLDPTRAARFSLQMRIPSWCADAKVVVNGQPVQRIAGAGAFLAVEREWKEGDTVDLAMAMPWRLVKGRKAQSGRVAVMRGPIVFCLNRSRHKELTKSDLRWITLDPSSLEGPIVDDTVRPGGLACRIRAWSPGSWYPMARPDLYLTLTEFADPGGEATYFHVPDPNAHGFLDDELIQSKERR